MTDQSPGDPVIVLRMFLEAQTITILHSSGLKQSIHGYSFEYNVNKAGPQGTLDFCKGYWKLGVIPEILLDPDSD